METPSVFASYSLGVKNGAMRGAYRLSNTSKETYKEEHAKIANDIAKHELLVVM